jgi:periplasmic protein CpxP/Spy
MRWPSRSTLLKRLRDAIHASICTATKLYKEPVERKQTRTILRLSLLDPRATTARITTEIDMATDTQTTPEIPQRPPRRWGRRLLTAVLLIGLGGVVGFAAGAHKASAMLWYGMHAMRHNPERLAEHVQWRVNRILSRAGASEEQKGKAGVIAKSAVTDLAALGIAPWETRSKFLSLFRADKIEPEAFESLRAEQAAKWEAASKRIVQALVETAQVLTPEQRRQLTERMARHDFH